MCCADVVRPQLMKCSRCNFRPPDPVHVRIRCAILIVYCNGHAHIKCDPGSEPVSFAHTAPPPQSLSLMQLRKQSPCGSMRIGLAPTVVAFAGMSMGQVVRGGMLFVRFGAHHMNNACVIFPVMGFQTKLSIIRPSSSSRQLIGGLQLLQSSGEP